jgi:beta-barrel assembly-enhancing protease
MKKVLFAFIVLVLFFGGLFYVVSQVNWMKLFRIEKAKDKLEKSLGDVFWDIYARNEKISSDKTAIDSVSLLIRTLSVANGINPHMIKLHLAENEQINAFALPDHHMVVNTGLLKAVQSRDELAGVLAHEIAHMELNHVMKKLAKEISFAALAGMLGGEVASELIRDAIRMLSSTAYDRSLEKDADLKAIVYLKNAGIPVKGFADFLGRLGDEQEGPVDLTWMSTHPDSKERAKYILAQ